MVVFAVVGAVNTVLDFGIFYLLISLGPLKANVVSTIVATTSSYLMNRYWTYRDRVGGQAVHREYLLFFAFNLVGLGIQEVILGLARYGFGFDEGAHSVALLLFKLAGVAVAMVFRFWAYRTFVFRQVTPPEAAAILLDAPVLELPVPAVLDMRTAEVPATGARG